MKMKRLTGLLLIVVMVATMLAGCTSRKENESAKNQKEDGKISISLYAYDRSMFKELTPWLEQKFPDIEFTFIQSFNTMEYYKDLLNRETSGAIRWLPMCAEVDSIMANKDLFDRYNIPLPTNYDEFVAAIDAFEELGIKGFQTDWA